MAYIYFPERKGRIAGLHTGQGGRLLGGSATASPAPDSVTPRVLTYTTNDAIDERISIPAQHSLVRLSKNPATSADAVGMRNTINENRLAGIYCVNWGEVA